MPNIILQSLLVISFLFISESCEPNESCMLTATDMGVVKVIRECERFMKLSKKKQRKIPYCGWVSHEQLVCCPIESKAITVKDMCQSFGDNLGFRIIGGSMSSVGEFPHFASLGYRTENNTKNSVLSFKCAGALISKNFVLTAAHCTKSSYHLDVVRLGKVRFELSIQELY